MSKQVESVLSLLVEELKKWVARSLFLVITSILVFIFTPVSEFLVAIWNVPDRLSSIEQQITDLQTITKSLSGEDRIIRQPPKLSYVEEPVYIGDNIFLVIVAEKTSLGRSCRLLEMQGLFTDESRIATPGQFPKYTRKIDIGDIPTTSKVEIIPPPNLAPGRVEVYLVLEFECNGATHFDRTEVLTFKLLQRV